MGLLGATGRLASFTTTYLAGKSAPQGSPITVQHHTADPSLTVTGMKVATGVKAVVTGDALTACC